VDIRSGSGRKCRLVAVTTVQVAVSTTHLQKAGHAGVQTCAVCCMRSALYSTHIIASARLWMSVLLVEVALALRRADEVVQRARGPEPAASKGHPAATAGADEAKRG
jgi:hypothetical protein